MTPSRTYDAPLVHAPDPPPAPMTLYVVRHAKAGDRAAWRGPDVDRPLTKPGRRQAEALVALLAPEGPVEVASSPHVRCIQTVQPLASHLGLAVETTDTLAEGAAPECLVERFYAAMDTPRVWCSHGDVIPDFIGYLRASHDLELDGEPDWRKAATWVVRRSPGGRLHARALPPPA